MYIYDRPLVALSSEQQTFVQPPFQISKIPRHTICMKRWSGLGQDVSLPVSYNQPGQTLNPQADYILAPEVMDAVIRLLSTPVPAQHLKALGSNVNPLMIERSLIIYRYDNGPLRVGNVNFGTKGLRTSTGTTRYSVELEYHTFMDAGTGQVAYPWLYIHTHPAVQKLPEVPSGITQESTKLSGDLYALRNEPARQIGIMTIGVNNVIPNIRNTPQPIPFTLAIPDPIDGSTDYRATPIPETHKAAAAALRMIFKGRTISCYYTGDLRTGRAVPYLSAREQRKLTKKQVVDR